MIIFWKAWHIFVLCIHLVTWTNNDEVFGIATLITDANPKLVLSKAKHVVSDGLKALRLKEAVSALPSNISKKINIKKDMRLGRTSLSCSVKQSDGESCGSAKPKVVPVSAHLEEEISEKLLKLYSHFDEIELGLSIEIGSQTLFTTFATLDLPEAVEKTLKGYKSDLINYFSDAKDFIKRLDFVYHHRNTIFHTSYNIRNQETTLELVQQMENLYEFRGKQFHVVPKLQVALDNKLTGDTRLCLNFKRGNGTITPIIYPFSKEYELLVEGCLTKDVKIGAFFGRNKNIYLNISYGSNWGNKSWQSVAVRFVFPDVLKSYIQLFNEFRI